MKNEDSGRAPYFLDRRKATRAMPEGSDRRNKKPKLNKRQGQNNVNARLTISKVKSIRKLWPNKSQTFLAKKYGVYPSTIHKIVSGFNWRHCL